MKAVYDKYKKQLVDHNNLEEDHKARYTPERVIEIKQLIQVYHDLYEETMRRGHMKNMVSHFARERRVSFKDYPDVECRTCTAWDCHYTVTVRPN